MFLLLCAFAASIAGSARAQIVPVVREVVAVRGSPALIEVRVGADESTPIVMRKTGADMAIEARLVWPFVPRVGGGPDEIPLTRWASAANPLRLSDVRMPGASSAYLVIEVPPDAPDRTLVLIAGAAVVLNVFDDAEPGFLQQLASRASMVSPQGARDPMLTLPDPSSPFERFRYQLGVAMRGWQEPEPFAEGTGDALAARSVCATWRAALSRLTSGGVGPAVELAELLVATCTDESAPAPIAAWIAGPDELGGILRIAFERDFAVDRLSASLNELLRVRTPIFWWIDDSDRDSVTVAFANPTTRPQVARYQWVVGSENDLVPLALEVPAAEVRRARINRPSPKDAPVLAGEPMAVERLRISSGNSSLNLLVPPAFLPSDARGVEFAEFAAPLTLARVQGLSSAAAPALRSVRVAIRERLSGWEIYAELNGSEGSITAVGTKQGSVRVDAGGSVGVEQCGIEAETVEFTAYESSVRASFVVPVEWILRSEDDEARTILEVGLRRECAGGFVDAPFASVPWRPRPRTAAIDLSARQ